MKKKLIALIPYTIVLILNFYLLPLLVKDTGMAMLIMLCIIPIITFCFSVAYGVRQELNIYLLVAVVLLFAPTILGIHYCICTHLSGGHWYRTIVLPKKIT